MTRKLGGFAWSNVDYYWLIPNIGDFKEVQNFSAKGERNQMSYVWGSEAGTHCC